ncbi:transposase [Planctomycetota bacterium]
MARMARFKISEEEAWYHVHSRTAGLKGEYVLSKPLARKRLMDLIQHYSQAYFCEVAGVTVMGNHWHGILQFSQPREVSAEELRQRAEILYPSETSQIMLDQWLPEKWERLQERLFDVSEFMRNVQSAFARWYNKTYQRRGRFWADRFKSVYLGTSQAVLDCLLYVELNPVRAGLVTRPEQWKGSSLYLREIGKDEWLMPLRELMNKRSHKQALREYRERLYYRGNVPTKPGQQAISDRVLADEKARGFEVAGVYRKRLGYFADGVAIGTEAFIREQLGQMRERGQYLRRKHPIVQPDSLHLSLREQRSTAVVF